MRRWGYRSIGFGAIAVLLIACSGQKSKTADTDSTSFKDKEQKLDFLRKYMSHMEGVLDAEYHIVYHDNGAGAVPGPSDCSITVAVLVEPDSLVHWLDKCADKDTLIDIGLWRAAMPGFDWPVTGAPCICHPEPGVEKVVYRKDGIVLARYSTM